MPILETFTTWLATVLFGAGLSNIRENLKRPEILEAFEKASEKIFDDYPDLFSKYTLVALSSVDRFKKGESFLYQVDKEFDVGRFPDIKELSKFLFDRWERCKNRINAKDAVNFFLLPEDEAEIIINKLSEYFFVELTQIEKLREPFKVRALQKLLNKSLDLATDRSTQHSPTDKDQDSYSGVIDKNKTKDLIEHDKTLIISEAADKIFELVSEKFDSLPDQSSVSSHEPSLISQEISENISKAENFQKQQKFEALCANESETPTP